LLIVCILAVSNFFVWRTVAAPRELEIHILSVGKGDATLVRAPSGTTVLIDAGPDASILRALGTALPYGTRQIDALVELTSLSAAAGGVPEVEERYHIAHIYFAGGLLPGTRLNLGSGTSIDILSLGIARSVRISYGATSMTIASSSPAGDYRSNGVTITKD
jgi:beta-lactamase superfamily II metal-dependent hydrolase